MFNPLVRLILAGLALALVLALGFLRTLSLWEHGEIIPTSRPLADLFGIGRAGAMQYLAAVFGAYAVYAVALRSARQVSGRAGFWVVLVGTALLALILVPINPVGAQDVYHNIADARTLWLYGDNPAVTPPIFHAADPFYAHVPVWQAHPSAYGPLWYALSGLALPITGAALWPSVIAQKLLASLFLFAATALVMLIVRRTSSRDPALAGVLVGWNPLLLFETAGNAHNDIVMITCGLAALYALARGAWPAVFPLLALAVAVKHVLVILGPLLLVWMLWRRDIPRAQIAFSLALGAAAAATLYAPYLAGGDAFETLAWQARGIIASPGSAVTSLLIDYVELDLDEATNAMRLVMLSLFLAGYAVLVLSLRRHATTLTLFSTSAWAVFLFLVTVSWWFWPWYLTWLVPLAALTAQRHVALVATVFSMTAMLMYAAYYWQIFGDWHHTQRTTAAVVFIAPLLLAGLLALWSGKRAHRILGQAASVHR